MSSPENSIPKPESIHHSQEHRTSKTVDDLFDAWAQAEPDQLDEVVLNFYRNRKEANCPPTLPLDASGNVNWPQYKDHLFAWFAKRHQDWDIDQVEQAAENVTEAMQGMRFDILWRKYLETRGSSVAHLDSLFEANQKHSDKE